MPNDRPQTHHDSPEVVAKIDALLADNEGQHSSEWAMPIRDPLPPDLTFQIFDEARYWPTNTFQQSIDRANQVLTQSGWAHDRALELARTSTRSYQHWATELISIADHPHRDHLADIAVATFLSTSSLRQILDYHALDEADLEQICRPTTFRAFEQMHVALRDITMPIRARVERFAARLLGRITRRTQENNR